MGDLYLSDAAFWKRKRKIYPNAVACVGTKVGVFHDWHWWHATGQARDEFKSVELDILEQLRAVFTDSYSSIVHFHLYMIGKSVELAIPTIMVFCEEKEPRKKAKKAIEEGGILGKLQGFRIGHQAKQPGVGSLIQPATENNERDQPNPSGSAYDVYFDPSRPIQAFGMPIFVKHSNLLLRQATANAVFDGERCVYMSVSHVFFGNATSTHNNTTDSDSECDFGSGTEHENDDDCMDVTSRASISSPGESPDDRPDSDSPESGSSTWTTEGALAKSTPYDEHLSSTKQIIQAEPMEWRLSDNSATKSTPPIESLEYLGCMLRSSVELDWALIAIINSKVYTSVYRVKSTAQSNHGHPNHLAHVSATQIIAHTSHGPISGVLSDSASYMRLPSSISFQKVHQITLDSPLDWGDCGAGVSDAFSATPYGHVVVSSTTKRVAYIVAAPEVMDASRTQWDMPSPVDMKVSPNEIKEQAIAHRVLPGCNQDLLKSPIQMNPLIAEDMITFHRGSPLHRYDTNFSRGSATSDFSWAPLSALHSHKKPSSPPLTMSNLPPSDGGLCFITGGTPADLLSKKNMTIVRKKAMDYFLKDDKKVMVQDQMPGWTSESSTYPKTRTNDKVLKSVGALPPAPIVLPMRTDVPLPYDEFISPVLVSIGKAVDPFRTMFQSAGPCVSVEELKFHYSRYFGTRAMGKYWIPKLLNRPHTFLGTLLMSSTHHDTVHELPVESLETASLRQEIIQLIGAELLEPTSSVDDYNLIAVTQLIVSEVMAGGMAGLSWHEEGLEMMVKQRGGLDELDKTLASMISWTALESAAFRETKPRNMHLEYCRSRSIRNYPLTATIPESPLYMPRGRYVTLQRAVQCKEQTLEILSDIRMMIEIFIHETRQSRRNSETLLNIYKKITSDYVSVSQLRQATVLAPSYWKYEAVRIASVIQATSIVKRLPLPEALKHLAEGRKKSSPSKSASSASTESLVLPTGFYDSPFSFSTSSPSSNLSDTIYSQSDYSSRSSYSRSRSSFDKPLSSFTSNYLESRLLFFPPSPQSTSAETILESLKTALDNSDLSACWDDMAGVLLWIGLTVGAASRREISKPLKKYFAALAVRVSFVLCFEHPEAIHSTLLRMSEIIEALSPRPSESERKQV